MVHGHAGAARSERPALFYGASMKVFVTGATGFIGSALVPELITAGHRVLGLARSDAAAQSLIAAGAEVHRGSLENLDSLRDGAAQSDAVIHCAYGNDFSKMEQIARQESQVIDILGGALIGSDRPMLITSVAAVGAAPGQIATEDYYNPKSRNPRMSTELAGEAIANRGVNVTVVRLSQVHNTVRQGFVSALIRVARDKGASAYVGDGTNRWAAAHLNDVVRLYRLALEKHERNSRFHAVAEEGVPLRQIADTIGKVLGLPVIRLSPEEASAHFGWLSMFAGMDMPASSQHTQQRLGWYPSGPSLITDLDQMQQTSTTQPAH
jgi:nucleoside-diphosphate-sugar epimerase